ncbi:unnamed protein product [Zymoseptoria tritici ST99CH_3D7]|uniref:Uncharacterized protein n=1 Tax=Zymoseptoria tritici (strain ST99CH_3D7) TaxID=1276538 RepID=A0A1X7RMB5_ZYMT9|nr:unnamed protein product [Zymoseptoria tritici ST99CH_3D7]
MRDALKQVEHAIREYVGGEEYSLEQFETTEADKLAPGSIMMSVPGTEGLVGTDASKLRTRETKSARLAGEAPWRCFSTCGFFFHNSFCTPPTSINNNTHTNTRWLHESAPDAKRTKYCGFHAAMAKKGKAWGNHISEECRDKYKLYARHEEKTRNADKPNRITKHSHTKAKLGKNLTNLCFALRTLEK